MLTITARGITWMTPFSLCSTSRYLIRDHRNGPDGIRITYQLERPKCRYSVLVLTHAAAADMDIGWNVVGYPSLKSANQNRTEDALGCYLYRH
jgi:hypothetical protein